MVGIGRGSAGGSLVLFLMGITKIDPIKYNLIFERFLLPERAGLAPMDVTIIEPSIESEEYVKIELENGYIIKLDKDAELLVVRNDEKIKVYADELQNDDDIVWDRRDELFTLPRIINHNENS